MTNRLSNTNSPYLLQHANNPVDWHPWDEEALAKARVENKPIFLSIGYAACHWCHVMAHESFEDPKTAAILNRHFVPIKVDREERPDLDAIYMRATTAMTGSGGWPMSVFLTPRLEPFYAGTYFPPVRRHGLPGFTELLESLARAWTDDPAHVGRLAARLVKDLEDRTGPPTAAPPDAAILAAAESELVNTADRVNGGWGRAPKFPQPNAIEFLIRRAASGRGSGGGGIDIALKTLRLMARGGMYDVVGGGFARYSTDERWHVPHFEKMLYDNAQLSLAYLHAGVAAKDPFFVRIASETLNFVMRELSHPEGGFFSSLDADSEGREGSFYVWTEDQLRTAIADSALFSLFAAAYGVTSNGNWNDHIVLQRALDDESLAVRLHVSLEEVQQSLGECHTRLLAKRGQRPRPATDDKIIAAWNGLTLQAFAQAARFLGAGGRGDVYGQVATRNGAFILDRLVHGGQLMRVWREGRSGIHGFLDDYAAVAVGLLDLYQWDFQARWYEGAQLIAEEMLRKFSDPLGGFLDVSGDSKGLLFRPKDLQDNATPSGNALACEALLKLAALAGDERYNDAAERALPLGLQHAARHPTAFARWLCVGDFALADGAQLAILHPPGGAPAHFLERINEDYRPDLIVAASAQPPDAAAPALLAARPLVGAKATAYLCRNFVCRQPVTDAEELLAQL